MLPTVVGLQVTAVLVVLITVAVNCCVCEALSTAVDGLTTIATTPGGTSVMGAETLLV